MLSSGLHPLGRDRPKLVPQIYLSPSSTNDFASACGSEDQELQRVGSHALLLTKFAHKARHIRVGQRRMMLHPRDLATRRQQIVEVPAPASGVRPGTELADSRPIQDRFDTTSNPAGRLGLGVPDGL